jgi:hypothetical protein
LERRINILIWNEKKCWFENDEYFRISTLYQFGELLGWIRIVEREVGFLPFESDKRCREFNQRINGVFRALCSHAYFHRRWFRDVDAVDASIIPRLMLSAIGEAMTEAKDKKAVIEFTEFVTAYANNERFRRWFLELETFLRNAHPADALRWDRLIAAGTNLRALVWFLDPHGAMVRRRNAENQDLLVHDEVRIELAKEMPQILTGGRQKSRWTNSHKKIVTIYTFVKARYVARSINRRQKTWSCTYTAFVLLHESVGELGTSTARMLGITVPLPLSGRADEVIEWCEGRFKMKLSRRKFLHLAAGAAALPTATRFASALDYPTRPVHLIEGFGAGGATDIVGDW